MTTYNKFIQRKSFRPVSVGFDPDLKWYPLFDFQNDIVRWACNRGRAAIFADTGLGKTLMRNVAEAERQQYDLFGAA